ncbi:MAG: EF-P 5-aminopentanol modification-associated protein YfmH [Candidatus Sericytochromatia bacterium]
MPSTTYETIHETVHRETLPNGLEVVLVPKRGYSKTYAVFTTRYGSIDHHFQVEGEPAREVPDGIAHFLEHKLFEEEWGDIFHKFSELGASANAFTSHNRTAYLFSATERVEESLSTLLDFVQRPHLTPESVEKEKGIIEQEIRMYDDMPFWRGYKHLLEGLFHVHPVRIDIAGTVESIAKIDRDTLMSCYASFYHPGNMVLAVVGDFDPERIMTLIRENQAAKSFSPPRGIKRFVEVEPPTVASARHEVKLAVSRPLALFGFKEKRPFEGIAQLRQELLMGLALDLIFGRASELYTELLDSGLIDDSFSFDYEVGPGFGFSYVGSETPDPAALESRIKAGLTAVLERGLDPEDFERGRRKQLGDFLHMLNSPEAIANYVTEIRFKEGDFFALPDLLTELTVEEANQALREHYDLDQIAVSLVLPNGEAASEEAA